MLRRPFAPPRHEQAGPLQRQAAAWLLLLTSGEATAADAEMLAQWRGQSGAHEAAFRAVATLRPALAAAARDHVAAHGRPLAAPQQHVPLRVGRRQALVAGGALAAAGAGYAVWRPPLGLWPSLADMTADWRTGAGQQHVVTPAAGISVALNTRTSLVAAPGSGGAHVTLIDGEALFTARRDPDAPLVVTAGSGRTIASAARCDIRREAEAVIVTCLDGALHVALPGSTVALQAAQQMRYAGDAPGPVTAANLDVVTAWRRGLIIIQDQPLRDLVQELNRYRPGRIILTNAALGRRLVSGVFHIDRLEAALEQIRALGAQIRRLPGGIVLLS
jgi:transmembrane sensor